MHAPLVLIGVMFLTACGARSNLRDGAGAGREITSTPGASGAAGVGGQPVGTGGNGGIAAGGSGGTSGAGGAGGGGGTGGGGMPVEGWPCVLAVDGPTGIADVMGFQQSSPRLSYSGDDGGQVTIGMRWDKSGAPATAELRHVSFSPWGAWPAGDLGPTYLASPDQGGSFDITRAPGNRFALVMSDTQLAGTGIWFAPAMTPGSGAISTPTHIDDDPFVLFAAGRGNRYLVGLSAGAGGLKQFRIVTVNGATVSAGPSQPLTCAGVYSGLHSAHAIPTAGGWLVAATGVGSFGASDCKDSGQYDTAIHLANVDSAGNPTLVSTTTVPEGPYLHTVLTALPQQNPWLAWGGYTPSPGSDGVARLDPEGKMLSQVAVPSAGGNRFAAAPMLGGLLLGRGHYTGVNLTFVHPDGSVSSTMPIPALDGTGVLGALPSPDGKSVLLTLQPWPVEPEARIKLARVHCQ